MNKILANNQSKSLADLKVTPEISAAAPLNLKNLLMDIL